MSRIVLLVITCTLVGALLPAVDAHVDNFSQSRALQAGPYLVFFEPKPTPPFANQTASMLAQVSDSNTGALVPRIATSILVAGPDFTQRKAMESDGTGYLIASMRLPNAGNYSARVFVTDPQTNETYAAQTEFEVFPDIPYRVTPLDPSVDVYAGQRTTLAFQVLDHITLEASDPKDLDVRLEHWSEDHSRFIAADHVAATPAGYGVWRIEYTFPEKGMYHMRFASQGGDFNYSDLPLLHVYAIPATEAASAKTPFPAFGAVLAIAAVIAILRKR